MEEHYEKLTEATIEELVDVTPEDLDDFMRLLPQLSEKQASLDAEVVEAHLRAAVNPNNQDARVVVIRDEDGRIQATTTAVICRIPTGAKAWVEDVVTDKNHRGLGWGRRLMEELEDWLSKDRDITSVNLTSNLLRGAAGRLYESMGYKKYPTRVYRKSIGETAVQNA